MSALEENVLQSMVNQMDEMQELVAKKILKLDDLNVFSSKTKPIWDKLSEDEKGDVMRLFVTAQANKRRAARFLENASRFKISVNQLVADYLNLFTHTMDLIQKILETATDRDS